MSASATLTEYHCDKSSFRIIKPLGSGSTCEVFLAQLVDAKKPHKCEVCALKIVNLKDKVASKQTQLRAEVLALRNIGKHPNIIGLQNYGYDPASATSFVQLSYVGGGDLLSHIEKRPFTEAEAIPMFRDILSAVAFAHSKGFCHRDLKLENILLTDTGAAVVADWGLSTQFTPTTHLQKDCGSLHYAAPEILSASPYLGHLVDSFSLGILFFAMVTGCFPFFGASPRERYLDIATRKRLPFPSHVSVGVRDLISKLLAFTPANRISPAQAVHHFVLEPPAKPKSSAAARIFDVIVPPVSVSVPAGAESSKKSPKTIVSKFFRTSPPKKRSSSKDRNSSSLEDCHVSDDLVTA